MINAICFDLDGVYFTEKGKKEWHKNLVKLAGNEEKVIHVLYKSDEMLKFVKGEMDETKFWDYVREYLGLGLTDQEFRYLWVKDYEIDQEVRGLLLNLKKQGHLICTCSNNNIARVEGLQDRFGFLNDFDVPIFSYEVGEVKPDKKIYQELIDKSKSSPDEIVYSDDNPDRIKGAEELGINVFVYESFQGFVVELEKLGVKI